MNSRKIAALVALVPLLALALTGLSLAHWNDRVDLEGSVSMGTFNIKMSLDGVGDNEGSLDVGSVSAQLQTYNYNGNDDTDGGVNDLLKVNISNMYPGYKACVMFDVDNVGTIPAKVDPHDFVVEFTSSTFDWDSYKEYFNISLYYVPTSGSPVLLEHQNYTTSGNVVYDYDYTSDSLGLFYLDAGETEHFMLCIGLIGSSSVNAPEDLMGQSFTFAMPLTWEQAVPTSP